MLKCFRTASHVARIVTITVVALLSLIGCTRWFGTGRAIQSIGAIPVEIEQGHRHSYDCGHYKYGEQWYYLEGHIHGENCGHVEFNSIWVLKVL